MHKVFSLFSAKANKITLFREISYFISMIENFISRIMIKKEFLNYFRVNKEISK